MKCCLQVTGWMPARLAAGQLHCPPLSPSPAPQTRVVLDPYAKVIFNGRQRWGEMGPVRVLPCTACREQLLLGWLQAGGRLRDGICGARLSVAACPALQSTPLPPSACSPPTTPSHARTRTRTQSRTCPTAPQACSATLPPGRRRRPRCRRPLGRLPLTGRGTAPWGCPWRIW